MPLPARAGRDPGLFLWTLTKRIWVDCPSCSKPALVQREGYNAARLSCLACGHAWATQAPRLPGKATSPQSLRCFRCGSALPKFQSRASRSHAGTYSRTLRCQGCGAQARYELDAAEPNMRDGVDPWFGLPVFLRTRVGTHELWALNPEHLDHLEHYLGANLRKRSLHPHHMTMMARLPHWMKSAGSRIQIARALSALRRKAVSLPDGTSS